MKKISTVLFFALTFHFVQAQSAKKDCELDFSNLTNVFHGDYWEGDNLAYGFLTDGTDTLSISNAHYISIHKMKCSTKKVGLWFSSCDTKCTNITSQLLGDPTISFEKTLTNNYRIQPIVVEYFSEKFDGLSAFDQKGVTIDTVENNAVQATIHYEFNLEKAEEGILKKTLGPLTEISVSFPDKSFLKFIKVKEGEYTLITSGSGWASRYGKNF